MDNQGPEVLSSTDPGMSTQNQTAAESPPEDVPTSSLRVHLTRYDKETTQKIISLLPTEPPPGIYTPLKSNKNFRLLCLANTPGAHDLSGVLVEQTIGEALPYDCLSYVWGAPASVYSINVGGKQLPITPSLDCALRAIRWRIDADMPFALIWVDAICINQTDLLERNQQVGQMCDIYRNAEQVIAHLGDQADGSERIPAFVGDLMEKLGKFPKSNGRGDGLGPSWTCEESGYEEIGLPAKSDKIWEDFAQFLVRPWFSRAWIKQEALLARHLIYKSSISHANTTEVRNFHLGYRISQTQSF